MATSPRRFAGCGRPSASQLAWSIAFFVLLSVERVLARRLELPDAVRYLLPVAPLAAGFFYMRSMVADFRRQSDELQLRIYLEAAVVAVCGLFVVMFSYPLLEAAGWVGPLEHMTVLLVLFVFGSIGYYVAWRRYR
jgi:hypothetical protein